MNAIEVARPYFDACNRHDANGIIATFAEGAPANNPVAGNGLTGEAIGRFAKGVFTYPVASFELILRPSVSFTTALCVSVTSRSQPDMRNAKCCVHPPYV
jgi:hypothetical protein